MERSLEAALGGLLLLLLPIPLLIGVAGGIQISSGKSQGFWVGLLVLSIAALLVWFCAVVGWRLVTGQRNNGQLMPAWLLYVGAFVGTTVAFRKTGYGPEYANRDLEQVSKSLDESLGRNRFKDQK